IDHEGAAGLPLTIAAVAAVHEHRWRGEPIPYRGAGAATLEVVCHAISPTMLSRAVFGHASILLRHPEDLGGEPRIDLGELRRDDGPQQPQRLGGRGWRGRYVPRPAQLKTGVVDDLRDRMAGMDRGKCDVPRPRIEGKLAASGDGRDGPAGAMTLVRVGSRRSDEIAPFDQRGAAVLEPERDPLGQDVIEIRRAERAWKAHRR